MVELNLQKCLQLAVIVEQMGAKFYEKMARRFADSPEVGEVFAQLAKDENAHEEYFKTLAEAAREDEELNADFETQMVLRATVISEFFRQDVFKTFDDISTAQDALSKAVALEKSTLFYYMSLREVLGANEQLNDLIKAERSHLAILMKIVLTNAKFRGLADQWG